MDGSTSLDVGRRLRLLAPGAPATNDGRLAVVVPRGAFGSGEHETTAACLELLEELPGVAGARVLDLGSGTGVLGIAAVVLGAASALLVDPDPRAVATAAEAIRLNHVEHRAQGLEGTLADVHDGPFDLVLANVYADVLISDAAPLVAATAAGATMVLSGLAWEQVHDVRRPYELLGCRVVAERWGKEWVTLHLAAPNHHHRR